MKRSKNIIKPIITATFLLFIHLHHAEGDERQVQQTIAVNGVSRSYELYIPGGYDDKRKFPLVIVLHGASASGMVIREYTKFNILAEKKNFFVSYPDAIGEYWNDGRIDMNSQAFTTNIDDVKFISQLINHVSSSYSIDANKVYAVGFSNGGMMAYRLGIALSEKLAAIASVAGALPKHCTMVSPAKRIPVLAINGTNDRTVPWSGGKLGKKKKHGEVLSILDTMLYWVVKNKCSTKAGVQILPDVDIEDGTVVFKMTFGCIEQESEVQLLTIQGGGHTWPGARQYLPVEKVERTSQDINATEYIWDFFSRHSRN